MSTAIDSNVLMALWNEDDTSNTQARSALDTAQARGRLVIAAPLFAELLAAPSRTPTVRRSPQKAAGLRPAPYSCRFPDRAHALHHGLRLRGRSSARWQNEDGSISETSCVAGKDASSGKSYFAFRPKNL
jgi:hypothetical protein